MKQERDNWDDVFRSKLYEREEEVAPEWEAIEARLSRPAVSWWRTWYAWAAVAALLLTLAGGVYFASEREESSAYLEAITPETEPVHNDAYPATLPEKLLAQAEATQPARTQRLWAEPKAGPTRVQAGRNAELLAAVLPRMETSAPVWDTEMPVSVRPVEVHQQEIPQAKPRKWGFGMGAGSLSAGNNSSVGSFGLRGSSLMANESLQVMNSASQIGQLSKTDIHHKMPVSFGVAVSYYLGKRWSLQTGLTYSYLASEWKTESAYWGENKQKLHFLGIPLGATYQIAEWNRFQFYASAGGKVELNVAGKLRTELHSPEEPIVSLTEKQRMKEPYFSVNGRVGVSYPIIRFVSAYAEVGADYYFDNGSEIETYHSEKPFSFGLQFGFRLGF